MKDSVSRLLVLTVLSLLCLAASPAIAAESVVKPDLVVLVVVDQLRGDMPWRFRERFGDGGFRYPMDHGTVYLNAQYQHANTLTAVGHATLVTGGNAAQHGMVANNWFDANKGRTVYCVQDPQHPVIGPWIEDEAGTGRSPRNLTASTIGDELVLASDGHSRVFSVSLKDRAAIIMGGHLGKAWWYSKANGRFVTSSYYQEKLPDWVRQWNAAGAADRYAGSTWDLLQARSSYVFANQDDRPYEKPEGSLGRTFPHPLASDDPAVFYDSFRSTPMADELTLDFVRALMKAEEPGQRGATDLLAVSFSATDYIGHDYGPFSLEAEDNMLRLDRTLASLLHMIDDEVGLDHALVVLTSDHGVAPIPEYAGEKGFHSGRHDPAKFMPELNTALQSRFGTQENLLGAFLSPGIYLDASAVEKAGLRMTEVEHALADEAMKLDGISMAFARSDLLSGRVARTPEAQRVLTAFHPQRSGNVILVASTYWYLNKKPMGDATTHGALHRYDTHVPLMLAGPGIRGGAVSREVAPRDLAPTLSMYLGIAPPSDAVGIPLREALER